MNYKNPKGELMEFPFMDNNLNLELRIEDLLGRLTLEEKFKLCAGRHMWYTKPIKRLGIKSFGMYDGPHGVRPDFEGKRKCTYFPAAICRAATWNPDLSLRFGKAVAQEVRELGAHMLLAPGINIQRTPMCGRTFEYQTEDPNLNKVLAIAVVKGIQSQRIAACVKHFVCNNQETNRFTVSSELSERALHEIYLPAFKATVQEADAWSFMSCYNKVNGIYGSEHKTLLKEKLVEDWGFRGFVVSDWNATAYTKTVDCVNAGLSLEMPLANKYKVKVLQNAFEEEKFKLEKIDNNVKRLLRVMFLTGLFDDEHTLPPGTRNTPEHQAIARQIAEEGIVLLKNVGNLLPLNINKLKRVALLGPNADLKTSIGGGSSQNFPPYEITPFEGIKEKSKNLFEINDDPSKSDISIVFIGLNHELGMDSEGEDKRSFNLPVDQIKLINNTLKKNPNTIVVLINGSPVGMNEWLENVPVVIEAWYGGMEAGRAIANILFGDVNPSGKLPITFPRKLSDSPAHTSPRTFPGRDKVFYDEGIFVGYRHFDNKNIEPLFPFGFGLSYTSFKYKNLKLSKEKISSEDILNISMEIANSGGYYGAEVVQLYVQDIESSVERPVKELRGFKKVFLNQNEKCNITFELKKEDFAFYDESSGSWKVEDSFFNILIGSSSRDIRLQARIEFINSK